MNDLNLWESFLYKQWSSKCFAVQKHKKHLQGQMSQFIKYRIPLIFFKLSLRKFLVIGQNIWVIWLHGHIQLCFVSIAVVFQTMLTKYRSSYFSYQSTVNVYCFRFVLPDSGMEIISSNIRYDLNPLRTEQDRPTHFWRWLRKKMTINCVEGGTKIKESRYAFIPWSAFNLRPQENLVSCPRVIIHSEVKC